MKKKVVALLQARTDSTRLPKKVLKSLLGKPMIVHELIRVSKSTLINELILITSDQSTDNLLVEVVKSAGFSVSRGSKDNVLERFYQCVKNLDLEDNDIIVRLTGDCPLHDAIVIDELINAFMDSNVDYMANCVIPIYPDGLDAEVFTVASLNQTYLEASKLSQKEHVTPYIRDSGLFKVADLNKEAIHPEWRLTVDEPTDFILIEKIYNYFGTNDFSFVDVKNYLEENPDMLDINSEINRNEGYLKSLKEDNDG